MSRRHFLQQTSALGAASLLGLSNESRAEPPPEVGTIRLAHAPAICLAPQYLAEDLLHLEGFSKVEYVGSEDYAEPSAIVSAGQADLSMEGSTSLLPRLDSGRTLVVLAGVHGGCYELFGNEHVRTIRDIKGKRVAIIDFSGAAHVYISSIMAYVA